ncbi:MAG: ACT domain-containing protein [Thermoplasmata archaeon]|nr:ACT domain-containing protein [Thermoplasmata archaeon]
MGTSRARLPSTADETRAYIDEHPSIRDALQEDLLNFAFLARKIQAERGIRNGEAVEMACRRYHQELHAENGRPPGLARVLAHSRLEVRSRVALLRIREDAGILDKLYQIGRGLLPSLRRRGMFQMYQGTRALTILCEDDLLATLLEAIPARAVLGVERGLASVALRSEAEVEETPGVIATFAEALYRQGINCMETVSVYTDSIFVFREEQVIPGYAALSHLLGSTEDAAPTATRPRRSARVRAPKGRAG